MTAYGSYGTLLKIASTTIAQVVSINGFSLSKETIETTHLASTSRFKTFISTLRDAGDIDAEIEWDPVDTSHEALEDNYMGDAVATFSIVWPDAAPTTWSCSGLVTGISPAVANGEVLKQSIKIKLTGVPTLD